MTNNAQIKGWPLLLGILSQRTVTDNNGKTVGVAVCRVADYETRAPKEELHVRFFWIGQDGTWQPSAAGYDLTTLTVPSRWSDCKGGLLLDGGSNWSVDAETMARLRDWMRGVKDGEEKDALLKSERETRYVNYLRDFARGRK